MAKGSTLRLCLLLAGACGLAGGRPNTRLWSRLNNNNKLLNDRNNRPVMGAPIINGTNAKEDETPYQIFLRAHGITDHYCGGTIITDDFTLTAAHCVAGDFITSLSIKAGIVNRDENTAINRTVTEIYYFPNSEDRVIENDIALLKVDSPFPSDHPRIKAIDYQKRFPADNTSCIVSGWGDTEDPEELDVRILRVLTVPIISREVCQNAYPTLQEDRFCAGFLEGKKDTCQGDSGGPLVCAGLLTGVVEGGDGCALAGKPGTYTDVAYYSSWIDTVLRNETRPDKVFTPGVDDNNDIPLDYGPVDYSDNDDGYINDNIPTVDSITTIDTRNCTNNGTSGHNNHRPYPGTNEYHGGETKVDFTNGNNSSPHITIGKGDGNVNIDLHFTILTKA